MKPLIIFKDVSRNYYENKKLIVAIKNFSFKAYPHKILSLLGPTGCGKTTILRLIADVIKPTKGSILYQDKDISFARRNGLIGLVPQSPTLMPNRTVEDNIRLPLEIKKIKDNKTVKDLIKFVRLEGFGKLYPHQLSGGMKQRVALARALVYKPTILLMDEPFSNLDEIIRERLNEELINIQRHLNHTIIFVTHNVEEAVFISDRIIVMSAAPGKKLGEITIDMPRIRNLNLRGSQEFFNKVKKIRNLLQKTYA